MQIGRSESVLCLPVSVRELPTSNFQSVEQAWAGGKMRGTEYTNTYLLFSIRGSGRERGYN